MRVGRAVLLTGAFALAVAASACGRSNVEGATAGDDTTATPEPTATATPAAEVPPPIVLMHGMAGWSVIGGYEYFNGIPEALRNDGYQVFATTVDPFQSVEVRAAQAAQQIDEILAETGAKKVHLIGHSQGGLDARYLVASLGYGDRVASVTTFATPNRGSKVSDVSLALIPGDAQAATAAIADALLGTATSTSADIGTQVHEMTYSFMTNEFNPANPDDPNVVYYSVAGSTQPWLTLHPDQVDVVNPLLAPAWWIDDALEGENDGLVSVDSARWGTFLGVIPADHMDEVGQPPLSMHPAFDQVAFFRRLAAFLYGNGPNPVGAP